MSIQAEDLEALYASGRWSRVRNMFEESNMIEVQLKRLYERKAAINNRIAQELVDFNKDFD